MNVWEIIYCCGLGLTLLGCIVAYARGASMSWAHWLGAFAVIGLLWPLMWSAVVIMAIKQSHDEAVKEQKAFEEGRKRRDEWRRRLQEFK